MGFSRSAKKPSHFHAGAYNCLRALNDGDQLVFWKTIKKTRLELAQDIGLTSLESTKSVYPALAKLQFLGEIENAWHLRWGEGGSGGRGGKGGGGGDVNSMILDDESVMVRMGGVDMRAAGGTQAVLPSSLSLNGMENK